MSSTTQKHYTFTSEPIQGKIISDVPGIGMVSGIGLTKKGFDMADVLLGQFLILKKNKFFFREWLEMEKVGMSKNNIKKCSDALEEYCENFL
jgi:hypothetical protein